MTNMTFVAIKKLNMHVYKQAETGMVVHGFNPRTLKQRQADNSEFEASMVYTVS